jgi:uncharacterized protein
MKIAITSDLHGKASAYYSFIRFADESKADVVIIAGDLTAFSQDSRREETRLKSIIGKLKCPLLFIMGNDDENEWSDDLSIINANQKVVSIKNIDFVGYQFSNPFIGGSFEKSESDQQKDLIDLAKYTKPGYIFISHNPPFGILDEPISGKHVGSKALLSFVNDTNPRLHIFGHIHECFGIMSSSINASYPNKKTFLLFDSSSGIIQQKKDVG